MKITLTISYAGNRVELVEITNEGRNAAETLVQAFSGTTTPAQTDRGRHMALEALDRVYASAKAQLSRPVVVVTKPEPQPDAEAKLAEAAGRLPCRHCGEPIYRLPHTSKWLHQDSELTSCAGKLTYAEPTPVKWGEDGPEIGHVVGVRQTDEGLTVDTEITDPGTAEIVTAGALQGFSMFSIHESPLVPPGTVYAVPGGYEMVDSQGLKIAGLIPSASPADDDAEPSDPEATVLHEAEEAATDGNG